MTVWCHLLLQGPRTYHRAEVSKAKVTLGRSIKCDIVVQEPTVSLKHLVIERLSDGRVVITDIPESSGTFVRSSQGTRFKKIATGQEHEIGNGDFVSFGPGRDVFFSLDLDTKSEPAEQRQQENGGLKRSAKSVSSDEVPARSNGRKRESNPSSANKESNTGVKRQASDNKPIDLSSGEESTKDVPSTSAGPKRRHKGAAPGDEEKASSSTTKIPDDSSFLQEFLTCHICHSLLYQPVNIAPCNHCFCAGCLSPWLNNSKNCPTCRTKIDKATLHHILKNIIEAYVKRHPEAERPVEERANLDKQDTITKPKKAPKRASRRGANANNGDSQHSHADPFLHMVFSMLNSHHHHHQPGPTPSFNTLFHFHDEDDPFLDNDDDDDDVDGDDSHVEYVEMNDSDSDQVEQDDDDDDDDDDGDDDEHEHEHHHSHDNCRIS